MLPIIPFAVGAIVGAGAVSYYRKLRKTSRVEEAEQKIRDTAASGMHGLKSSTDSLRRHIATGMVSAAEAVAPKTTVNKTAPAKKTVTKKSSAAKPKTPAKMKDKEAE